MEIKPAYVNIELFLYLKTCVKSFLKTDIFLQKILIFLLPQKRASAPPIACCNHSQRKSIAVPLL